MTTLPRTGLSQVKPLTREQIAIAVEAHRRIWLDNNTPTPRDIHDDEYRTGLDGGFYDEEEREARNY